MGSVAVVEGFASSKNMSVSLLFVQPGLGTLFTRSDLNFYLDL